MISATRLLLTLLLILSVSAIDNNLQKEVQIPNEQTKISSQRSSLFQSIFGKFNTATKESGQGDNTINERAIFKGLKSLNQFRGDNQLNRGQNDLELPYQALLPRRRTPIDVKFQNAEKLFGLMDQSLKTKPEEDLVLRLQTNGQNEQPAKWQNPLFTSRENGEQIPFYKIFGKKSNRRSKAVQSISESKIQPLLIKKVPFLQGGKILKMVSNHYKKGVFLNIQFEDKEGKIYNIIARYRLKKHRLEIISIKLNNNLTKVDSQVPALQDKSKQTKRQEIQNVLKQKDEELKILHERLQKMEELNKALQAKAAPKELPQTKTQQRDQKKVQNQTVNDKKEELPKQNSKMIEDKKETVQQKKEQKKIQVEKPNLNTQQTSKPPETENILNQ